MQRAGLKTENHEEGLLKRVVRRNGGKLKAFAASTMLALYLPLVPIAPEVLNNRSVATNSSWSGRMARAMDGNFMSISSDFTIPRISMGCDIYQPTPRGPFSGYSEFSNPSVTIWVGLGDGTLLREQSLIQLGIVGNYPTSAGGWNFGSGTPSGGGAPGITYNAFWEALPERMNIVDRFVAQPGDRVRASITRLSDSSDQFRLALKNLSRKGQEFSINVRYKSMTGYPAPHLSAEVMVERPSKGVDSFVFHPLAGFGYVSFDNISIGYEKPGGGIEDISLDSPDTITEVMSGKTRSGKYYFLAAPSILSSSGTGFDVADQYCSATSR